MGLTVTHRHAVHTLERPAGMYQPSWVKLQKLLLVLCKFGPDPYPGMRLLSEKTGIPLRTVSRLLFTAEEKGLIARTPRPIPGHRDSYVYHLLCVPVSVPVSDQTGTEKTKSSPPSEENPPSRRRGAERRTNKWAGECVVCGTVVPPKQGWLHGRLPVHRFCDSGEIDFGQLKEHVMGLRDQQRQIQEDLDGPVALGENPNPAPVTTSVSAKPAVRLARTFESRWITDALRAYPEWRGEHRCIHPGPAIGYINSQFLAKGFTEEHIEAYFDAYYAELLDPASALQPKPGQSVWQLFTGWWGSTSVPDPAIERAIRAENERLQAMGREQVAVKRAARDEAWERVSAAMDAGVDPDPEDLRAAGLPQIRRRVV